MKIRDGKTGPVWPAFRKRTVTGGNALFSAPQNYEKHMDALMKGWVERGGVRISPDEAAAIFLRDPHAASEFGGEFFLSGGRCSARDHFGIVPGHTPPGRIVCSGRVIGEVAPRVSPMNLDPAITEAVRLRSDHGAVALSGGVDSTLIAALAGLPCISVGLPGSRDPECAEKAARRLGLDCTLAAIRPGEVEGAVMKVLDTIPSITPVNVAIATTQYFIARTAREQGHSRVLSGQGADELFGGYSRYANVEDIESELARDFLSLGCQAERDQSVAALHGVLLSMPYLDTRVVQAARSIPASGKVRGSLRKVALREVAEHHIPREFAWADKKAMQYGSGIWKEIRRLAKKGGFPGVSGYISALSGESPDRQTRPHCGP